MKNKNFLSPLIFFLIVGELVFFIFVASWQMTKEYGPPALLYTAIGSAIAAIVSRRGGAAIGWTICSSILFMLWVFVNSGFPGNAKDAIGPIIGLAILSITLISVLRTLWRKLRIVK